MKALIISDIHENFGRFKVKNLPDADVCFIAGDITNYGKQGTPKSLYKAEQWLLSLKTKYPQIFCIPGNHDISFGNTPFAETPGIDYIMDTTVTWEGYTIHGVSLTQCYDMPELVTCWDYMTCRPEVELAAFDFEKVDIVLSHGPPLGILDKAGYDLITRTFVHIGSPALLLYLDNHNPKFVFCGHEHSSFGTQEYKSTCVINAAEHAILVDLETKEILQW